MEVIRAVCPHDCPDPCSMLVTVDDDGRAVRTWNETPSQALTDLGGGATFFDNLVEVRA